MAALSCIFDPLVGFAAVGVFVALEVVVFGDGNAQRFDPTVVVV